MTKKYRNPPIPSIPFLLAAFCLCATSAFADALEGKKSGADILAETTNDDWRRIDPEQLLVIELDRGEIVIALSPKLAADHVAQIKTLARSGYYDGLSFYRVIDGFVAQGGDLFEQRDSDAPVMKAAFDEPALETIDPWLQRDRDGYAQRVGWLDSLPIGVDLGVDRGGKTVSPRIWHLHCAGAFAFGREDGPNTARTEFYITLQPQRYLDRNLTVAGRVIDGMEHVQALRRVAPAASQDGDLGEEIVRFSVMADWPPQERITFDILDSARPAFAAYAEARRNRPESFFYHRPDYLDPCAMPVPVRRNPGE